jgi:hypothetical protein
MYEFGKLIEPDLIISFSNKFWGHISEKSSLQTWLDIENEYYTLLKDFLRDPRRHAKSWPTVKDLNREFNDVKCLLEKYLTEVCKKEIELDSEINKVFVSGIKYREIAISERGKFLSVIPKEKERLSNVVRNAPPQYDHFNRMNEQQLEVELGGSIKRMGVSPLSTLVLNFNYTNTAEKYGKPDEYDHEDYENGEKPEYDLVNIHGELNNESNPIIFGYGDELDEDYRAIERTQDNDFLENIKSIHYHNTGNYRRLLNFLQYGPYQVFVLGHSCGNSDRTLLNTIFEHENCISIKPFYHQRRDEKTKKLTDNYTDITKNISRNFNDKQAMREIVVNKEYCLPLRPCDTAP